MTARTHAYDVLVTWTGNRGVGTAGYGTYGRDHESVAGQAPVLLGSADPAFRGDPARWNPEQLLVAALAQCHLLWYLHLAAEAGVIVTAYTDDALGSMAENRSGAGEFTQVTLRPTVTITPESDPVAAASLHDRAHEMCFIARSVAFPVHHEPRIVSEPQLP